MAVRDTLLREGQLAGTALLVGEQAGNSPLQTETCPAAVASTSKSLCSKDEFPVGMHRDHHTGGFFAHENRNGDQAFGGALGNMGNARFFRVVSRSDRISSGSPLRITYSVKGVSEFPTALGQYAAIPDFEIESDFFSVLECDVEVTSIENLSEFNLNGAQDFVRVEAGTDGLSNLR